jgi:hypothetical protein
MFSYLITSTSLAMLLFSFPLLANEPQIANLTPPQISSNTLLEEMEFLRLLDRNSEFFLGHPWDQSK